MTISAGNKDEYKVRHTSALCNSDEVAYMQGKLLRVHFNLKYMKKEIILYNPG